jgi:hypothetical protein
MGQETDIKALYEEDERSDFLETSILAANYKFFKGNDRLDSDDLILYNTVIQYFKGNS